MTREEFAMLLIRRANLQEWIALVENERWPVDTPQRSKENVLAAYHSMLETVDIALQKAPRALRRHYGFTDRNETTGSTGN